jgi:hypothetical protein
MSLLLTAVPASGYMIIAPPALRNIHSYTVSLVTLYV